MSFRYVSVLHQANGIETDVDDPYDKVAHDPLELKRELAPCHKDDKECVQTSRPRKSIHDGDPLNYYEKHLHRRPRSENSGSVEDIIGTDDVIFEDRNTEIANEERDRSIENMKFNDNDGPGAFEETEVNPNLGKTRYITIFVEH